MVTVTWSLLSYYCITCYHYKDSVTWSVRTFFVPVGRSPRKGSRLTPSIHYIRFSERSEPQGNGEEKNRM